MLATHNTALITAYALASWVKVRRILKTPEP